MLDSSTHTPPAKAVAPGATNTELGTAGDSSASPGVSVIVLNYNGSRWIERCLRSLDAQTCRDQLELIVADNQSTDGSEVLAARTIETWAWARFLPLGANLGYCQGNNRGAAHARGRYLFFLNNDTWLEPDCLEQLLCTVQALGAHAAIPLVLDYDSNDFQSAGALGFDVFGLATARRRVGQPRPILMPEGCSYLIEREWFARLGGFDPEFFMFADELDLSWRVWISGGRAVVVPNARLHHRGAANVNPAGGGTVSELRTSDTKRFYANRNNLLVLLKNAQHLLLLLVPLQLLLLFVEALVALCLVRRWSFVRRAYLEAVRDCWRLRPHIRQERKRIRALRQHGDFWMLRFLRLRLNRWDELRRILRLGKLHVTRD